jgi:predicted TIM-barrel fold metal-dependent hydrolase
MLPMHSIDSAIEEIRFVRKVLGMRGGFLRPNPYNDHMAGDPAYDLFWAEAQELDCAIGFHEGGASGMPTVGVARFESRGARHIISHTMAMMLVAVSVIWGRVSARFPKVRIGFLESGGGWVAPWLERMDRHCDDQGLNDSGLQTRPSELFQRNCWISFEPVARSLDVLAEYVRWPAQDALGHRLSASRWVFPGSPGTDRHSARPPAATKRGILAGGAQAFYGLE